MFIFSRNLPKVPPPPPVVIVRNVEDYQNFDPKQYSKAEIGKSRHLLKLYKQNIHL
jgi:hypothetical protein